jgi:hypothetical protein
VTAQADLFADVEADDRREAYVRQTWRGQLPSVGDYVTTAGICGTLEDGSRLYCYTERVRLVEQRTDGKWIGVIDMGMVHGRPWGKDGTRLVMGLDEMQPEYRRRNT